MLPGTQRDANVGNGSLAHITLQMIPLGIKEYKKQSLWLQSV